VPDRATVTGARSGAHVSAAGGPAKAVVSACAVSTELPTSVSLIFTSACFFWYSSTAAFWLMPENDQKSNDLSSPPLDPELLLEHPAAASTTRATAVHAMRNLTANLPSLLNALAAADRGVRHRLRTDAHRRGCARC
jgi:hypothetical protein